jgi:para-nitrobenzyl esterase
VAGGQVRGGLMAGGGAAFKGVPFAAPPVGDLRWRDPAPPQPWTGVKETTAYGPPCAQNPYFIADAATTSREDCLYLNVWNAEWPATTSKPVMVWVPGGGNFAGAASQSGYDGESLARRGVVLVTMNYRVGMFGFFSHPAISAESARTSSGNQGLLDQITALTWVRDHIARFGGDASNVTLFGESAGALDVSALMTSPLAKGLFHKAIAQSGAVVLVGPPQTLAQAEARGRTSAAKWGLPATATAADLREVSAAAILKSEDVERDMPPNLGLTIDGHVFPQPPASIFAAGSQHAVPLIGGSNSADTIPGAPLPADMRADMRNLYGPLAAKALPLYTGQDAVIQWSVDTTFRCTGILQLGWHTAAGHPGYQFQFSRVTPGRNSPGAIHASELNYVFGTLRADAAIPPGNVQFPGAMPPGEIKFDDVDVRVSDVMQRYWTNFAKTGDPNGDGLPQWPQFDSTRRAYIEFTDSGPVAGEGLRRAHCDLFAENVNRLSAPR